MYYSHVAPPDGTEVLISAPETGPPALYYAEVSQEALPLRAVSDCPGRWLCRLGRRQEERVRMFTLQASLALLSSSALVEVKGDRQGNGTSVLEATWYENEKLGEYECGCLSQRFAGSLG